MDGAETAYHGAEDDGDGENHEERHALPFPSRRGPRHRRVSFARARRLAPTFHAAYLQQAAALVGLGRLDELEPLVAEALTTESKGGGFLLALAHELDAHGFRSESVEIADRAAEWWATTNLVDPRFPVTFYSRYSNPNDVSDYREPLPTAWAMPTRPPWLLKTHS